MKLPCSIYRSTRRDGLYLYLRRGTRLEDLPEALRSQFGRGEHAMDLVLEPTRRLARADAAEVIDAIKRQSYYLQLPPQDEPG